MLLTEQLAHQRFILPGPLVLGKSLLNILRPQQIGDRTVSRRSEPSSRTALIGEQPNPWDLLQPQDAMSRHRTWFLLSQEVDYIICLFWILADPSCDGRDRIIFSLMLTRVGVLPKTKCLESSLSGQSLQGHDGISIFHNTTSVTKTEYCMLRCRKTSHGITDRHEPTIARLRYSLGGDRPSQTARQALSPTLSQGLG